LNFKYTKTTVSQTIPHIASENKAWFQFVDFSPLPHNKVLKC